MIKSLIFCFLPKLVSTRWKSFNQSSCFIGDADMTLRVGVGLYAFSSCIPYFISVGLERPEKQGDRFPQFP